MRAAAPKQKSRKHDGKAVAIESGDIRARVRERRAGNTVLFVVDSSGSMGADRRMSEAKGAVLSLLIDAYEKRDRVGLIAFKGSDAEVLLEPTSSVELARQRLEELPTGGKTPLSKGLAVAHALLGKEMTNRKAKALLVLISDGRANRAMEERADPVKESIEIASRIAHSGIQAIVIDTESGFVKLGLPRRIADAMKAKYYSMEDLKAEKLSRIVREEA